MHIERHHTISTVSLAFLLTASTAALAATIYLVYFFQLD